MLNLSPRFCTRNNRYKLADCIVNGRKLIIAGGNYRLCGGVSGEADFAVKALLLGMLKYNPDVHCDHHDHEHGDGEHTCGEHGCGKHDCH